MTETVAIKASIRIRHAGCVTEVLNDSTTVTQITGDRAHDLFVLHAAKPGEVPEVLELLTDGLAWGPEVVSHKSASVLFRGVNRAGGTVAILQASTCSILWPVVYRDGHEFFTIIAPDRETVRSAVGELEQVGAVNVRRVQQVDPRSMDVAVPIGDLVSGLTPRQLEIMLTAVRGGYYNRPRTIASEHLADQFDITASTLSEHLRKAEETVMSEVARLLAHKPALARGANKGPGRPPKVDP